MNSTEVENIMIILHEVDKEQEQDLQEHWSLISDQKSRSEISIVMYQGKENGW